MTQPDQYPNHHLLKRHRLMVLAEANYRCQCGKPAVLTHHINHDKSDHRIDNLKAFCVACHRKQHVRDGWTYQSKYSRVFGKSLSQMAKEAKVSKAVMYLQLAEQKGGQIQLERLLDPTYPY